MRWVSLKYPMVENYVLRELPSLCRAARKKQAEPLSPCMEVGRSRRFKSFQKNHPTHTTGRRSHGEVSEIFLRSVGAATKGTHLNKDTKNANHDLYLPANIYPSLGKTLTLVRIH